MAGCRPYISAQEDPPRRSSDFVPGIGSFLHIKDKLTQRRQTVPYVNIGSRSRIKILLNDDLLLSTGSYQQEDLSIAGSFPREYNYGDVEERIDLSSNGGIIKPKILLMGGGRSGKSSIVQVVFHKMSSNETLYLESNNDIKKEDISNSPFVQFEIWDVYGGIDLHDEKNHEIFEDCDAIVFVIDAQDELNGVKQSVGMLQLAIEHAQRVNNNVNIDVFIHKVDGLSDDQKMERQREIHSQIESLMDSVNVSLNLTSIYDHSIFEAFSKTVQKLIPQLPMLENLLTVFISHSQIERGFLFDLSSKIYIATDSYPVDMQLYELCCDMIDLTLDISAIYGATEFPFDAESASMIKMSNSTVLYLKEVGKCMALVGIIRTDNFRNQGLIDYNFEGFKQGVTQLFRLRNKGSGSVTPNLGSSNGFLPPVPPNTVA